MDSTVVMKVIRSSYSLVLILKFYSLDHCFDALIERLDSSITQLID